MKIKFSQKHPAPASVLWTLMLLVFYFAAGFIVTVRKMSATDSMLIRAGFVFAACLLAVFYIGRSEHSFSDFGFKGVTKKGIKKAGFFLPILAMEAVPLFAGFRENNDSPYILAVLACTLCVGFAEEIYYRGFAFSILKPKGLQFAIVLSSVIFGCEHLINMAGGAGAAETILQIFFAFFFGFVCAEIQVITGSILPIMIWHALHDFLVYTTNEGSMTFIIASASIQTLILIVYGIYLYTVIKKLPA